MKIKEKLNIKKIVEKSEENQQQLTNLFKELDTKELSNIEKTKILNQLNDLEDLANSIKEKLNS